MNSTAARCGLWLFGKEIIPLTYSLLLFYNNNKIFVLAGIGAYMIFNSFPFLAVFRGEGEKITKWEKEK